MNTIGIRVVVKTKKAEKQENPAKRKNERNEVIVENMFPRQSNTEALWVYHT